MKLELYSELCCDYCGEIIHHHIDCPICNEEYAETDAYGELWNDEFEITCEHCNTVFKRISENWYDFDNLEVEVISLSGIDN